MVVTDGPDDGGGEAAATSREEAPGGDDDEMSELIHNQDFLRSVLSTLPGVNPEEALQNLQEMTEQQKESKKGGVRELEGREGGREGERREGREGGSEGGR